MSLNIFHLVKLIPKIIKTRLYYLKFDIKNYMNNKKIAFVGLSHLGIIYSHAAAKKKFSVTAIDSNSTLLEDLKKNKFPFYENGLSNIGKKYKINYSNNFDIIKNFDLVFLSLDIKTDTKNRSNLKDFKKIFLKLQSLLKKFFFGYIISN